MLTRNAGTRTSIVVKDKVPLRKLLAILAASTTALHAGYHMTEIGMIETRVLHDLKSSWITSTFDLFSIGAGFSVQVVSRSELAIGIATCALFFGPGAAAATASLAWFSPRNILLALLAGPILIGPVIQTLSTSAGVWTIGRAISGFGSGGCLPVATTYVGAVTRSCAPKLLGTMAALCGLFFSTGMFLGSLGNYFLHDLVEWWRFVFLIPGFTAILQLVPVYMLCNEFKTVESYDDTESSAYDGNECDVTVVVSDLSLDSQKGRSNEENKNTENPQNDKYKGQNCSVTNDRSVCSFSEQNETATNNNSDETNASVCEILDVFSHNVNHVNVSNSEDYEKNKSTEKAKRISTNARFSVQQVQRQNSAIPSGQETTSLSEARYRSQTRGAMFRRAISLSAVHAAQHLCGMHVYFAYGYSILQESWGDLAAAKTLLCLGVYNMALAFVPVFLVDRVGRRALLLVSCAGMIISACVVFAWGQTSHWPALAGLAVGVTAFNVGLASIPMLIVPELAPNKKLAPVFTYLAYGVNSICAFAALMGFPLLKEKLGYHVFLVLAGATSVLAVIIFLSLPETSPKARSARAARVSQTQRNAHLQKTNESRV